MAAEIPANFLDLFSKRAFATLATLMPDGRPHATLVWCDFDAGYVRFNSARGRQKDHDVRRDPRVAMVITDPDNPYRYIEIRGRIVEITEDGAAEHFNHLAKKYLGVENYPHGQPGEVRAIYKVEPERVRTQV